MIRMLRLRPSVSVRAAMLGVLLSLGASGCGPMGRADASEGGNEDEEEEVATPVVTTRLARGEITAEIRASSTIEAERMVTVHAESTGRITTLAFEEGDEVKDGQLLARIKQDVQVSGLDRASTSLAQAKDDLATVKALYGRGVASKDELTAAQRAYDMAKLDVGDRRRDVGNTRVRAPFGGTVTERFVTEGGFVSTGAQLLSIVDFDTLVARVYVPEKELDRLKVGQDAQVEGKAAKGRQGTGTLERIAPVVDATTGTVKITVALPKQLVGSDSGFLPGMFAEVTLTTESRSDALLVPKRALVHDEEQSFLFVAEGDRVRRAKVTLGLTDRDHAEIVEGVGPGAEVVITGQAGLKDGGLITRVDENGEPVEGPEAAAAVAPKPSASSGDAGGAEAGDETSGDETSGAKASGKAKSGKAKSAEAKPGKAKSAAGGA